MRPILLAASCALLGARQWIDIRNVDLHLNDQVTLRVRSVHGEVLRTKADSPATLDDPQSFRIRIASGTVALTGDDLAGLLNAVILHYPGAPLSNVSVRITGTQLFVKGTLHKAGDHPIEMTGTVGLMPDGRIRLHVIKTHLVGINGEALLHTFGLHLDNAVSLQGAKGATIKGDDLFLDPLPYLPPPAIEGRLAAVRIEGAELVEEFARTPDDATFQRAVRPDTTGNFLYFRCGELRFGRLLMRDTDLRIMSQDPHKAFDLNLPHYSRQLVAGYSRTRADSGLTVFMPNFATLNAPH